jgi:hypothetical protein
MRFFGMMKHGQNLEDTDAFRSFVKIIIKKHPDYIQPQYQKKKIK